jgi:hypothetical protein
MASSMDWAVVALLLVALLAWVILRRKSLARNTGFIKDNMVPLTIVIGLVQVTSTVSATLLSLARIKS